MSLHSILRILLVVTWLGNLINILTTQGFSQCWIFNGVKGFLDKVSCLTKTSFVYESGVLVSEFWIFLAHPVCSLDFPSLPFCASRVFFLSFCTMTEFCYYYQTVRNWVHWYLVDGVWKVSVLLNWGFIPYFLDFLPKFAKLTVM